MTNSSHYSLSSQADLRNVGTKNDYIFIIMHNIIVGNQVTVAFLFKKIIFVTACYCHTCTHHLLL